ncbi:metal-sensitive transcriptional regulator [Spirochaeta dissipatitropha]
MNVDLKTTLQTRLKRAGGQIQGIQKMLDDDRYCMDIMAQTRAVISAMRKIEQEILRNHMQTCVTEAFEHGDDSDREQKIAEVIRALDSLGA